MPETAAVLAARSALFSLALRCRGDYWTVYSYGIAATSSPVSQVLLA
jgi:hypothetical protein